MPVIFFLILFGAGWFYLRVRHRKEHDAYLQTRQDAKRAKHEAGLARYPALREYEDVTPISEEQLQGWYRVTGLIGYLCIAVLVLSIFILHSPELGMFSFLLMLADGGVCFFCWSKLKWIQYKRDHPHLYPNG